MACGGVRGWLVRRQEQVADNMRVIDTRTGVATDAPTVEDSGKGIPLALIFAGALLVGLAIYIAQEAQRDGPRAAATRSAPE